jgi:hypothetical protein
MVVVIVPSSVYYSIFYNTLSTVALSNEFTKAILRDT